MKQRNAVPGRDQYQILYQIILDSGSIQSKRLTLKEFRFRLKELNEIKSGLIRFRLFLARLSLFDMKKIQKERGKNAITLFGKW